MLVNNSMFNFTIEYRVREWCVVALLAPLLFLSANTETRDFGFGLRLDNNSVYLKQKVP